MERWVTRYHSHLQWVRGFGRPGIAGELFAKSGMVAEPPEPRKPSQQAAMVGNHGNCEMTKGEVTLHNVYICWPSGSASYPFSILLPTTSAVVVNPLKKAPIHRYRVSVELLLRIRLDPSPAATGRCRHSCPDVCTKLQAGKQRAPTSKPAAADFVQFEGTLN